MSSNCSFNLSKSANATILDLKLAFISLGICTNIAAILFLAPKYKIRIFRIVLYAMIANGIEITLQLMELFPENGEKFPFTKDNFRWGLACKTFGYLDQCTTWMGYLCLTWVSMYVIYLYKNSLMLEKEFCSQSEIIGLTLCYLVPFAFNWIPFVHDYYGVSGAWCWIAMVKDDCNLIEGQIYMTLLYYGPLLLFVVVNVSSCMYVIHIFCSDRKYQAKEFVFVLCYPWLYGILSIVVAASRMRSIIDLHANKQQSFRLWQIHAVCDPLRMICLSILVIISALCRCRCCGKFGRTTSNRERIEPDEESLLHY